MPPKGERGKKETRRKKKELVNPKQLKFCYEYLIDLNQSQAYTRAGYTTKNANVMASQLMANPNIQAKIQELRIELQRKTKITPESVIQELAKIGFSNIKDFVNGNNSILEIKHIDNNIAASLSSIKTTVNANGVVVTQVRLHDKVKALEGLGKHLGIFEKDNRQRQPQNATAQELIDIVERIKALKKPVNCEQKF